MRRVPLLALFAVLVTAALGIGPAVAAAKYVTLKDKSGIKLLLGTAVKGTSTNTNIIAYGFSHECPKVEFSSTLAQNKHPEGAMVVGVMFPTFKCYYYDGTGLQYTFEVVELKSDSFKFLADNTVQYSIKSGVVKVYYKGSLSAYCTIDPEKSSTSAKWTGGLLPQPALIEYSNSLKYSNACPVYINAQMSGTFKLTDQKDQPIDIVVE